MCPTHCLSRRGLDGNTFTGSVPPELGKLTELTSLYALFPLRTPFTSLHTERSCITPSLGLRVLCRTVAGNSLSGEVPSELGKLSKLAILYALASMQLGRH